MSTLPAQTTSAKKTLKDLLNGEKFKTEMAKALPKHLKPDRQLRVMFTAINKNPKLENCTPESFCSCMLQLSALGLEPDGRRAHLIPFENKKQGITVCTLIVDYKGLVELAYNSGFLSNVHADIVRDKDEFEFDRGQLIRHKINFREERGEPYAVYALARFKDGGEKCEVLSVREAMVIRDRSQGYQAFKKGFTNSNPWETDEGEMLKKTAFRRLSKWIPLSPEIRDALDSEDESTVTVSPAPVGSDLKVIPMPKQEDPEGAIEVEAEATPEPAQETISAKDELAEWATSHGVTFDQFLDAIAMAKLAEPATASMWDNYQSIPAKDCESILKKHKQILVAFFAKVKGGGK